jgi:CheY-like chemotaxis protein
MNERILLIDDGECIRVPFATFLHGDGYAVECAATYAQGLDRITTQPFDLIIADILLDEQPG